MINQVKNLSQYQKQVLLNQAREALASWEEAGNPVIVGYEAHLNNEDESCLVLYKCQCGALVADYEDYSGRDEEADQCPKCGRSYDN